MEYGAKTERIDIANLGMQNVDADYVHKSTQSVAKTAGAEVDRTAKKYSDTPRS